MRDLIKSYKNAHVVEKSFWFDDRSVALSVRTDFNKSKKKLLDIVKYPILTEKTMGLFERNQYSFAVNSKADKIAIKSALEQLFDIKVISVNTSVLRLKKCRSRLNVGKKARYKRAIVTLSKESSMTLIEEE